MQKQLKLEAHPLHLLYQDEHQLHVWSCESYLASQAAEIRGGEELHETADLEIFLFCLRHIVAELYGLIFTQIQPFQ